MEFNEIIMKLAQLEEVGDNLFITGAVVTDTSGNKYPVAFFKMFDRKENISKDIDPIINTVNNFRSCIFSIDHLMDFRDKINERIEMMAALINSN